MKIRVLAERGFVLISAVFLLVILAALGAAMASLSTMQHTGAAIEVQETRAYQAARAGIEWGLYQVMTSSSCLPGQASFVPPAPTLNSFTVTVTCTATANIDPPITVRQLKSTACNLPAGGNCPPAAKGNTVDYVERVVQVTF